MFNVSVFTMVSTWSILMINNTFVLSGIFFQLLILLSIMLGIQSKYLGVVLFLVYVGGIMILISYCVMLMPSRKLNFTPPLLLSILASLSLVVNHSSYMFGIMSSASAILLLGLLLYLVMLSVVDIMDYSSGMMKL